MNPNSRERAETIWSWEYISSGPDTEISYRCGRHTWGVPLPETMRISSLRSISAVSSSSCEGFSAVPYTFVSFCASATGGSYLPKVAAESLHGKRQQQLRPVRGFRPSLTHSSVIVQALLVERTFLEYWLLNCFTEKGSTNFVLCGALQIISFRAYATAARSYLSGVQTELIQ